ncbi:MAG: hypothetical protein ACRC3B_09345 [Bacteroidia bacterium]
MYRNAVKTQQRSSGSSRAVPQQRQAQQQQVDQWLRQVVLSNQMQAQYSPPPPQPVASPYASYSAEQIIDEVADDSEIAIETELYEFEHRNTSPQNNPYGFDSAAGTTTSSPAAELSEWQNAVIMSELLGPPKGLQ